MVSLFASLLASLAIFPLLSAAFIYGIAFFMTKNKVRAMNWMVNSTTILLIISVHMTIEQLWNYSLLWLFLLIIFLILACLTFLQFSVYKEIHYHRLARGVMRLSFIFFLPLHLLLLLWVVISSAIRAAI